MFPSHLSVNDLGVFAVVMVFGLIVVLLFMFDFVSMKQIRFCVLRVPHVKNHRDQEKPPFHLSLSFLQANLHMRHLIAIQNDEQEHLVSLLHK